MQRSSSWDYQGAESSKDARKDTKEIKFLENGILLLLQSSVTEKDMLYMVVAFLPFVIFIWA